MKTKNFNYVEQIFFPFALIINLTKLTFNGIKVTGKACEKLISQDNLNSVVKTAENITLFLVKSGKLYSWSKVIKLVLKFFIQVIITWL